MDKVQHRSFNTTNGPSPAIWGDCPILDITVDPYRGYGIFDDFVNTPLPGTQTTEVQWYNGYKVFATASGYVKADETINSVETPGGILAFNGDTADDSASLATYAEPFKISGSSSTSGKLWFEARLAVSSAVTNGVGIFVGLAETQLWTLATGVPFSGTGDAITNSAAAIGFLYPEDDTTTADTVYSDRATSFTAIGDGEVTGIADNTFTKLGFVYDPERTSDCIRFFQDGVELSTKLSQSTITGLTNLDAGTLGLIYAHVADTAGTAIISYLDWWRCYQLRA